MNSQSAKPDSIVSTEAGTLLIFTGVPPNRVHRVVKSQADNLKWFEGVKITTEVNLVLEAWQTSVFIPAGKHFSLV